MEMWKTQEAAFSTFPQGLPPERPRQITNDNSEKDAGFARIINRTRSRASFHGPRGGILGDHPGGKLDDR